MLLVSYLPPGLLVLMILSCRLISAIPTWEGMNGRSSIGSLIPGVSSIEAKGPVATGKQPKYLTVHSPGMSRLWIAFFLLCSFYSLGGASNVTVGPPSKVPPPQFYINQEQLFLLVNETAVYPVNVQNSTATHHLPMQLVLGSKKEGITSGSWRWKNTMLYYDLPSGKSNDGVYYRCMTASGAYNVFMTFVASVLTQALSIVQ